MKSFDRVSPSYSRGREYGRDRSRDRSPRDSRSYQDRSYDRSGGDRYNDRYNDRSRSSRGFERSYDRSNDNYSGSSYRDGGSSYRDGGSSYRDGGSSYRDGGSSYRGGGSSYRDGGSSYRDGGSYGGNDRMSGLGADLSPVDYSIEKIESGEYGFYKEHEEVAKMSPADVQAIMKSKDLSIKAGRDVPKPIVKFEHAMFPSWIMDTIKSSGFESPSPIQTMSWPIALSGRDMIGIAQTGSGKTLSFILPALLHIGAQPKLQYGDGPIALVLAPTRELAEQIRAETDKFSRSSGFRNTVAYGGVPKRPQIFALRDGVEILIATPGRLIDFLQTNITNLRRVTYLVLDEADRMLDMGFEPQIKTIVSQIRPDRQTLMLSATWPKAVERLAHSLMKPDSIHILVGREDLTANSDITQHVYVLKDHEKDGKLEEILRSSKGAKTLVFTDTKRSCDRICHHLRHLGFPALAIHGDKKQEERTWVLDEFRSGSHPILIATDVASRGLDVKDVEMVVNTDMPTDIESYVHRIGRTGRAGSKGDAYTFLTDTDNKIANDLIKVLRDAKQIIPPEVEALARRPVPGRGGRGRGGGNPMLNRGGYGGGYGGNSYGGGGGYGGNSYGPSSYGGYSAPPPMPPSYSAAAPATYGASSGFSR